MTILLEQLRLFIILGQAAYDGYFMGGMNVSEAIRAHQDYLELSEGILEKKPLLALLSTPNQELSASCMISGAKSI